MDRGEAPKSSLDASKRWGSRSVEDIYEKEMCVGEGTYGQVFRAHARNKKDDIVALKRVRMDNEKEGFPITAIREIKLLKQLKHKNILELREIVTDSSGDGIYMVFEFMDHDLSGLIEAGYCFEPSTIKCYMKQLLEGLQYCHKNKVLHRDIKASNLLIDNKGRLKLADFGLARSQQSNSDANYTNRVITRWYRPPELLLGSTQYGPEVDMWSVGCIFYELLLRKPLFPGKSDIDQIDKIFQICGTPTQEIWPNFDRYSGSKYVHQDESGAERRTYPRILKSSFIRAIPETALDLLDKFLTLDPLKRISAHEALDHEYFWTDPLPANPSDIRPYDRSCHDFNMKKKKDRRPQQQQQASQPTTTTSTSNTQQPQQHPALQSSQRDHPTGYQARHNSATDEQQPPAKRQAVSSSSTSTPPARYPEPTEQSRKHIPSVAPSAASGGVQSSSRSRYQS
eukprot:c1189_g1_i1.p1 GENE.c1189_g1_i1~~c1189_g1_i1.p1  ORF type:complete len:454 (+),score=106.12 c1189_g1_i1:67-1428(+)